MKLIQSATLAIGLLFSNAHLIGGQNVTQDREKITDVAFCDLVREPSKYDGKVVRISATYSALRHSGFLYDQHCNDRSYFVHPILDCDSDETCKKLQDMLSNNASIFIIHSRTNIVAIGTFRGPGESNRGYGNESVFRFELAIKQIEKAAPTPTDTPWAR